MLHHKHLGKHLFHFKYAFSNVTDLQLEQMKKLIDAQKLSSLSKVDWVKFYHEVHGYLSWAPSVFPDPNNSPAISAFCRLAQGMPWCTIPILSACEAEPRNYEWKTCHFKSGDGLSWPTLSETQKMKVIMHIFRHTPHFPKITNAVVLGAMKAVAEQEATKTIDANSTAVEEFTTESTTTESTTESTTTEPTTTEPTSTESTTTEASIVGANADYYYGDLDNQNGAAQEEVDETFLEERTDNSTSTADVTGVSSEISQNPQFIAFNGVPMPIGEVHKVVHGEIKGVEAFQIGEKVLFLFVLLLLVVMKCSLNATVVPDYYSIINSMEIFHDQLLL